MTSIGLHRRAWLRRAGASALATFLAGCSGARVLDALVPRSGYRLLGNQRYRPGERGTLDLYLPEHAVTPTPLVVFIYGGDWRTGNKEQYRFIGQSFAARGFAVAIPDYRLYPEVRYPGFLEDNAAAVGWIMQNADLGFAPGSLFLMGHSAGAYNAAMLALDPRWLGTMGLDPRRDLRGFVGLAGPYDFLPLDEDTGPIFESAPELAQTQPVAHVLGGEAPMLLATGSADTTVRPRNTRSLAAALRGRGSRVTEKIYDGIGHVRLVAELSSPLRPLRPSILADTVGFLRGEA